MSNVKIESVDSAGRGRPASPGAPIPTSSLPLVALPAATGAMQALTVTTSAALISALTGFVAFADACTHVEITVTSGTVWACPDGSTPTPGSSPAFGKPLYNSGTYIYPVSTVNQMKVVTASGTAVIQLVQLRPTTN